MNVAGTPRLFLALWPDDTTRAALARCRDAWVWGPGAVPEPDGRLHLTLHFLGGVPRQRVPEAIDGLAVPVHRFTLRLDCSEGWPNGVAVLVPQAAPQALLVLHAQLRDALHRLGLATDSRPYRPHLTLARHAAHTAVPARSGSVSWPVRGYALVESHPATRDYVVLRRYGERSGRAEPGVPPRARTAGSS